MGNVSSSQLPMAAMAATPGAAADFPGSLQGSPGLGLSPAAMAAAADAAANDPAAAGNDASTPAGRHRQRVVQLEVKLQQYMDNEDCRVKELTEGVLYELLPAALNAILPQCDDPVMKLDAGRCRAVAGAALAASCLMNAPPGFLEFLLCIPWSQLPQLYPASFSLDQQGSGELPTQLAVDDQERRLLVNTPIHPQLMRPLLEFMYKPEHADSVPVVMRPAGQLSGQQQTPAAAAKAVGQQRNSAAAHQPPPAAAGGLGAAGEAATNAPQLLQCIADVELLELVAALLDGATPLHCAALRGNPAQVDHLLYCGADPTLRTAAGQPPLQLVPVCGLVQPGTIQRGCHCLSPLDQEVWECRSQVTRTLIARRCLWLAVWRVGLLRLLSLACLCFAALLGLTGGSNVLHRPAVKAHLQQRQQQRKQSAQARTLALLGRMKAEAKLGQEDMSPELAFRCFVRAVHALQSLDLQGGVVPHVVVDVARLFGRLRKTLHQQQLRRLLSVGRSLARVVQAHIALLCQTEARSSPSRASVWRAQQCLQEWDALAAAGLVDELRVWARTAESDLLIAEALLGSSLGPTTTVTEVLSAVLLHPAAARDGLSPGSSSTSHTGQGADCTGGSSTSCPPVLARPASAALLDQLQLARGLAVCPSPPVKQLAAQVADATARELSAAAKLRELLSSRATLSSPETVTALAEAIAAAAPFSSLAADVEAARLLHQQCCQRAEAAAKLQSVMQQVVDLTSQVCLHPAADAMPTAAGAGSGPAAGDMLFRGFSAADWEAHVLLLERTADDAKDANVCVIKARKIIKELQAQLAAAEAAAALDACLSRRPCGSASLKAAICKGEAAAAALNTGNLLSTSGSGSTTKKRLEVEKAAEALHKASMSCRAVADLARLEAAILNARKVGAEDLDPEEYKAASELRARLTGAARIRAQLDRALRALQAGTSPAARGQQLDQLVAPVEAAMQEAARWEELLPGEVDRAARALEAWRNSSACKAKLTAALQDGCSSAVLSRLITEAAGAGVKVSPARRVLKLQQGVEAAMAAVDEAAGSSQQYIQLAAKLEAAEQGCVAQSVLEPARQLLQKLQAAEARFALEAALKPHSDWSVNTKVAALKAALDKAEEVLGRGHVCDATHVMASVTELSVRAWHLLQRYQHQLEEVDRQRAEQDLARRALKEKERQERQRAEVARAEREKADRARAVAERKQARAKGSAGRGKGLAVVWASSLSSSASTDVPAPAVVNNSESAGQPVSTPSNGGLALPAASTSLVHATAGPDLSSQAGQAGADEVPGPHMLSHGLGAAVWGSRLGLGLGLGFNASTALPCVTPVSHYQASLGLGRPPPSCHTDDAAGGLLSPAAAAMCVSSAMLHETSMASFLPSAAILVGGAHTGSDMLSRPGAIDCCGSIMDVAGQALPAEQQLYQLPMSATAATVAAATPGGLSLAAADHDYCSMAGSISQPPGAVPGLSAFSHGYTPLPTAGGLARMAGGAAEAAEVPTALPGSINRSNDPVSVPASFDGCSAKSSDVSIAIRRPDSTADTALQLPDGLDFSPPAQSGGRILLH
eukprot:gene8350-8535_t